MLTDTKSEAFDPESWLTFSSARLGLLVSGLSLTPSSRLSAGGSGQLASRYLTLIAWCRGTNYASMDGMSTTQVHNGLHAVAYL